jgi:hypothetical protein
MTERVYTDPKDEIRQALQVIVTNAGIVQSSVARTVEPLQLLESVKDIEEAAMRIAGVLDRSSDMVYGGGDQ